MLQCFMKKQKKFVTIPLIIRTPLFAFIFGLILLYYTNHVTFKLLCCTLEAASYMDLHDYTAENNCRN